MEGIALQRGEEAVPVEDGALVGEALIIDEVQI